MAAPPAVDTPRVALLATGMNTVSASLKQRLVIAFSCVLVGCAVGATMPRIAAQSFPPNPAAPRWDQFCDVLRHNTLESANEAIAPRGRNGFELVSTTVVASDIWVCFKRPAAR